MLFMHNLYYLFVPSCAKYIDIKLVFWQVLGFVNAPIGPVYAHFTTDVMTVPLILHNTQKPSQILECIMGNACSLVGFLCNCWLNC